MNLIVQSGHLRIACTGDRCVVSGASMRHVRALTSDLRALLCVLISPNMRLLPPPSPKYLAEVRANVPDDEVHLLASLLAPHYEIKLKSNKSTPALACVDEQHLPAGVKSNTNSKSNKQTKKTINFSRLRQRATQKPC